MIIPKHIIQCSKQFHDALLCIFSDKQCFSAFVTERFEINVLSPHFMGLGSEPHELHILITGGAGFIGSNLADECISQGYKVTVLDNLLTGYKENISHLLNNPNFTFIIDRLCRFNRRLRHGLAYIFWHIWRGRFFNYLLMAPLQ